MVVVATIPSMITWVAGSVVTASEMNSQIRDTGNFLLARPACWVSNAAGIACTNNTATLVTYDTEVVDNDSMHSNSVNPSRIIFQTLGTWELHFYCRFPSNSTGIRTGNARLNSGGSSGGGSSVSTYAVPAVNGFNTFVERIFWYQPNNIGDYFEMFVTQNSGGSLTTDGGQNVTGITFQWLLNT